MQGIQQLKGKAKIQYDELAWPTEKQEQWRHTAIENISLDDTMFTVNPNMVLPKLSKTDLKNGVILATMDQAVTLHPDLLFSYYEQCSDQLDKIHRFNSANWTTGVFLYVPQNTKVETIIDISFSLTNHSCLRNLIIIEKSSSCQYKEHYIKNNVGKTVNSVVTEIVAKDNSSLHFIHLNSFKDNDVSINNIVGHMQNNASISWFTANFGGAMNRVKIDSHFKGTGANSKNSGVFIGKGHEHIDITTNAFHHVPHTTSDMNINGIMKDNSSSIYRGLIKIDHQAPETNSFLANHILKLSEHSIAHSIPALEIDTNDVKASHGATIGQIDNEQLFYLMSRGLSQEKAESLIVTGFFESIIEKIEHTQLRAQVQKFVHEHN